MPHRHPTSPPIDLMAPRGRAMCSMAFLAALGLLLLKSPDALLAPQFWAEDGAVFFNQQHLHAWPPLLEPYAGYLHFVPRMVAWLGSAFAAQHQPLVYNVAAMLIDAYAIGYVAWRVRAVAPVPAIVLSFFVLPTAGDIFGTVTNVQWFLQFAVFIACVRFPQDCTCAQPAWRRWGGAVLLLAASLSGPFSLLALAAMACAVVALGLLRSGGLQQAGPARFPWAGAWLPDGVRRGALLVVAMGAAAQVVTMLGSTVTTPESAYLLPWGRLAELGITRQRHAYLNIVLDPWRLPHVVLWCFLVACFAAGMVQLVRRPDWPRAVLFGLLCMGAVQPLLAYAKQHALHTLSSPSHYFYLWGVVSIWIVAGAVQRCIPQRGRWVASAVLAVVLLLGVYRFPDYFRRSPLAQLNWPGYAQRLASAQAPIVVPLNPLPWHMVVQPPALPGGHRP